MSARRRLNTTPSAPAPNYRRALVSYLDILGFKNLVSAPGNDPAEVRRTVLAVQRFLKREPEDLQDGSGVDLAFSDTVVRVTYLPTEGQYRTGVLFSEIFDIQLAQVELMSKGIFIRGGLVLGDVYVDPKEEVWFGPAIVKAYELEANADFPRVVIDPEVEAAFATDPALRSQTNTYAQERTYVARNVKRDVDGLAYVDVFAANAGDFDDGPEGMIAWYHNMKVHLIAAGKRYADRQTILRKYAWLSNRYQDAVKTHFTDERRDNLLLSAQEFPGLGPFG